MTGLLTRTPAGCMALGLVLLYEAGVPCAAAAQAFHLNPSIGVTEVYDSNLFFALSDRHTDSIWRVTSAIAPDYRSALWTFNGLFSVDSERFTEHPELNAAQARHHSMLDVRYRPTPRVTVGTATELSKTETPGDLNVETALTLGRATAERRAIRPSASYRFDPVTDGTLGYSYFEDRLAGIRTHTQAATVDLKRRLSSRDTVSVGYGFHHFRFGPGDVATSNVLKVGWSHNITPLASLTLDGGPRVSNGVPAPDLSAAFRYQLRTADLALSYARGQTTLIGLTGTVDMDSFGVTATYKPRPLVQMRIAPGVFRTRRVSTATQVYRLALGATCPLTQWLSLNAVYDLNAQRGDLYAGRPDDRIARHVAMVSLQAARPERPARRN